ncbi:MAG: OmpA family protein, partial [Bacteroidota bacterium]
GTALAAATPAPQSGTAPVAPATTATTTGTTTIAATAVGEPAAAATGSSSDQPVAAASKPVTDDLPELGDAFGLENVLFAFDKSRLGRVGFATMMRNYEALKAHPDAYIIVSAHTDSRGTNNYNQGLSERRAKTVVEFLVSRGIDRKRIYEIETHGETRLTNDCGDEASCAEALHKLNRRVELVVVNKVKASS